MTSLRAVGAILAVLLLGCDARRGVADGGVLALSANLAHAPFVEVHVHGAEAARVARRLAERDAARTGRRIEVVADAPGDPAAARVVVGVAGTPLVDELAAAAGITIGTVPAPQFRVLGVDHIGAGDVARATLADPRRPGLPVTVWIGNDLARLLASVEDVVPRAAPSLATWRAGEPALLGPLAPEGGVRPSETDRVGVRRLALRGTPAPAVEAAGFRVEHDPATPAEVVARVRAELERAHARAVAWIGAPWPGVRVRIAAGFEEYRLGGEPHRLGRWNRVEPAAEMLVLRELSDGGAAAVRAGLRAALGPAPVGWLEDGASTSAAASWCGRELDRWLAVLAQRPALPRVARLVDDAADASVSPHVLAPLRAALFDHLRATRGDAFVRDLWTGARTLAVDAELEASFAADFTARTVPHQDALRRAAAAFRARVLTAGPGAGAVLASALFDGPHGYGSRDAASAIAALRAAGAEAVALRADFLDVVVPDGPDPARALGPAQGDAAILAALVEARANGLATLLSAHALASDAGSYAASWAPDDDEWQATFDRLARAVEHAGHLANLAGADWLSIGTSLTAISGAAPDDRRARPDDANLRRVGWRSVVGAARGAFPGAITYAASDAPEALQVGFFGDLDAVGLEIAPRAARSAADPRGEIAARVTHALDAAGVVAERAGKPIVVTEASFAPIRDGRQRRLDDWAGVEVGTLAQVVAAVRARGLDVRGAFLARVPVDPADRGFGERDLVLDPAGRAAEFGALTGAFRTASRSPR